jgi:hypothetical protein
MFSGAIDNCLSLFTNSSVDIEVVKNVLNELPRLIERITKFVKSDKLLLGSSKVSTTIPVTLLPFKPIVAVKTSAIGA